MKFPARIYKRLFLKRFFSRRQDATQWAPGPLRGSAQEEAQRLIAEALAQAYADKPAPEGVKELLTRQEFAGDVCAIFYNGRSGSFFAQSFFDHERHPRVITVHPAALSMFDMVLPESEIERYKAGVLTPGPILAEWCSWLLDGLFKSIYTQHPGQPGLDGLCAPKELFTKLFYAQLLLLPPARMSHEQLLKMLFIAYRLSRGGPLDCSQSLVFLWQAHMPSPARKRWIRNAMPGSRFLTVMRFPEKSLDSHLVHHTFETVSPPLHTLFRRLFFEHLASDTQLSGGAVKGREMSVRFEDLHHHPEFVLRAWCEWLGVAYVPALTQNSFALYVQGNKVSGARKLTRAEFEPKLLNHYDRIKVRVLMQEEYRQWGYDALCEPGFEASLEEYRNQEIVRNCSFAVQALLGQMSGAVPDVLAAERQRLAELFQSMRKQRETGITLTPLLYSLSDLPGATAKTPVSVAG